MKTLAILLILMILVTVLIIRNRQLRKNFRVAFYAYFIMMAGFALIQLIRSGTPVETMTPIVLVIAAFVVLWGIFLVATNMIANRRAQKSPPIATKKSAARR